MAVEGNIGAEMSESIMQRLVKMLPMIALGTAGMMAVSLSVSAARADTIFADARADYRTPASGQTTASFNSGAGISDSAGLGHWNYGQTTDPVGGSVLLLTYTSSMLNTGGTPGYASTTTKYSNFYAIPALSNAKLFGDGADPSANELSWHGFNANFADVRWTAGAGEAGQVRISGAWDRVGEPASGAPSFFIYVDGVQKASASTVGSGTVIPFDLTVPISVGSRVDFLSGNASGGAESRFSAQISVVVPEPSTLALLAAGGLGLLGWARQRRRRFA